MKGYINGKAFEADEFGYDGCHKIYLCDSEEGKRQLAKYGYDFYPIEDLPSKWASSCPLRFIQSGDLSVSYVRQCEPAHFKGWDIPKDLEHELRIMEIEQLDANGEITSEEYVELMAEEGW